VIAVAIIGASGYTGAELLRLCAAHPAFEVTVVTADTQAGTAVASLYPSLAAAYPELVFVPYGEAALDGVDLAFLALPHGASQTIVPGLTTAVPRLIDLAADFRLRDAALYPEWYGEAHTAPSMLDRFVYGLPELFRDDLIGATAIAVPGCYPTSAALALGPLVASGLVDTTSLLVDAASGVSGAGRPPKPNTTFCAVDEDFSAYGLLRHRHTPEMEQTLHALQASGSGDEAEVRVLFTPHLAPMNRGILATCYARPKGETSTAQLMDLYQDRYGDEPFIVVSDRSPSTKATLGSNTAHLTVRYDERTGWILAICALDNLTKGASGQAVQCANLASGLEETTGLPSVGLYP
jgi:N-acetyl-gamma-glutamyl-phosphate reductase